MVIRNTNPPKICNGVRLVVTNLKKNINVGNILGGAGDGEQGVIPRVPPVSTDTPIHFKRKQFPVDLSFAMPLNKSQGQTFDRCGLLLDTAVLCCMFTSDEVGFSDYLYWNYEGRRRNSHELFLGKIIAVGEVNQHRQLPKERWGTEQLLFLKTPSH